MAAAVDGLDAVLKRLREVQQKLASKILLKGVKAGAKAALQGAKAAVRVDTGLLKKALASKAKGYKKGTVAVGIVGARSSYKMKKVKDAQGKVAKVKTETGFGKLFSRHGRKEIYAIPSLYSHLVEKGTKRSRAFPFLFPAGEAPGVSAKVVEVIAQGIEDAGNGA